MSQPTVSNIWLDEEVIQTLKRYKSPCEPDLNAVLRRLFELDLPDDQRTVIERAATSQSEYRTAVLQALVAEGGEAKMTSIYDRVKHTLRDVLKPIDFDGYNQGIRWQTAIRTTTNSKSANSMRSHGVIEYDRCGEVFRITPKGRKELECKH
jgi:hypothetical protein